MVNRDHFWLVVSLKDLYSLAAGKLSDIPKISSDIEHGPRHLYKCETEDGHPGFDLEGPQILGSLILSLGVIGIQGYGKKPPLPH